ncbi:MAG: DNA alkylation repair protein [Anaerolineaceae bacterium]|nr:DNA alkylation repair protein [Anaerolineaceae bacterium]
MPAIQLARLKTQIHALTWVFTRPYEFRDQIRALFQEYAEQAYRPGVVLLGSRRALAYRTPALLLRQLEQELTPLVHENPGATLMLVDVLWEETHLEPRQLAAFLLGQTRLPDPEEIIARVNSWCLPTLERGSLTALLNQGCAGLRRNHASRWLELVERWSSHPAPSFQSIALQALLPAVQSREFMNIPPIFQIISLLFTSHSATVQTHLIEVIFALARREPIETTSVLQNVLAENPTPETIRVVRRSLPAFKPNFQRILRHFLVAISSQSTAEEPEAGAA